MIPLILIVATIITFLFINKKNDIENKIKKRDILYYFCEYSLEFLIPFILITLLYSIIPIIVWIVPETVSLQSLIYLEETLTKLKSYFSIFKLNAVQVFVIFLTIYFLGILRLLAGKSIGFFKYFDKYRVLTRRVYIVLVLLCSLTLFGVQSGDPTKNLRLRIKTIRDGYADVCKDVQSGLTEEVNYDLFVRIMDGFPKFYSDAFSLPDKINGEVNSLRSNYTSAQKEYGINLANIESVLNTQSPPIEDIVKNDNANEGIIEKIQPPDLDPTRISFRKVKESKGSIEQFRNRLHTKFSNLLKIEGAQKVIGQIPSIFTSELKTALAQSLVETYPILEPIIDVYKNTIDKGIELRVKAVVDQLTSSIIQNPANAEELFKEQSKIIADEKNVEIPNTTLEKAKQVCDQLEKNLTDIKESKVELDEQVKIAVNWKNAQNQGTVESYESYLRDYPNSPYVPHAKEALDKIWNGIAEKNSIQVYEGFIKEHPNSSLVKKADMEIKKLFISKTPEEPSITLNANLSVDINWSPVSDAKSYRIYWSSDKYALIDKVNSEEINSTSIEQWPNEFPTYYYVVAVRNGLESHPSKPCEAVLLTDEGGTKCQICGDNSIGYCHNRNIYVCSKHNYYTSRSGEHWRCP